MYFVGHEMNNFEPFTVGITVPLCRYLHLMGCNISVLLGWVVWYLSLVKQKGLRTYICSTCIKVIQLL